MSVEFTPSKQLEIEPGSIDADDEAAAAEEGGLSVVGVAAAVIVVPSAATPRSDSKSRGDERDNDEDHDADLVDDVFIFVDDDMACFSAVILLPRLAAPDLPRALISGGKGKGLDDPPRFQSFVAMNSIMMRIID
jgi:hypothetical protein